MYIADPDHINRYLAFPYRGLRIELTTSQYGGRTVYSAWVDYATGSAVAVPLAHSRQEAIARAKAWVNRKFEFEA